MATVADKESIKNVVDNAKKVLDAKKIILEPGAAPRIIETVTEVCLEQMIVEAARLAEENGGNASLSFRNLFDIVIDNRPSDDGDKDGNIAIAFVPGPQAKLLAKKDTISEGEDD